MSHEDQLTTRIVRMILEHQDYAFTVSEIMLYAPTTGISVSNRFVPTEYRIRKTLKRLEEKKIIHRFSEATRKPGQPVRYTIYRLKG